MWPSGDRGLLPDAPAPDTAVGHAVDAAFSVGGCWRCSPPSWRWRRWWCAAGASRRRAPQVKWFGFGAAFGLLLNTTGLVPGFAWTRALGPSRCWPGIGLGIFRFRLYNVDRLINRNTRVWAVDGHPGRHVRRRGR